MWRLSHVWSSPISPHVWSSRVKSRARRPNLIRNSGWRWVGIFSLTPKVEATTLENFFLLSASLQVIRAALSGNRTNFLMPKEKGLRGELDSKSSRTFLLGVPGRSKKGIFCIRKRFMKSFNCFIAISTIYKFLISLKIGEDRLFNYRDFKGIHDICLCFKTSPH